MPALDESPRRVSHSAADRELLILNVWELCGSTPGGYIRTAVEQKIGTVITGRNSSGVSDERKDILSGESARWGNAPSHGRSGGPWSVFLLWILWTWGEPMSKIRQIFPRGKEGWFGREGQPPGPSVTVTRLTQVGVIIRLGNDRKMTPMDPNGPQTRMASQDRGVSLRLKRIAAIVRCQIVLQLWWIKFKLGPALALRVGWEPSGSLGALCESTPTANVAGWKQRVGTTGDARQGE